jgi:hypothetical protein
MVPLLPNYMVSSIPTIWFPSRPISWFPDTQPVGSPSHPTSWFPDTQPVGSHATRRSCHAAHSASILTPLPSDYSKIDSSSGTRNGVTRARICKPFKEPRNRFRAWRAGNVRQSICRTGPPSYIGAGGIYSSESIPGLLKHLQIRALMESPPPITRTLRGKLLYFQQYSTEMHFASEERILDLIFLFLIKTTSSLNHLITYG